MDAAGFQGVLRPGMARKPSRSSPTVPGAGGGYDFGLRLPSDGAFDDLLARIDEADNRWRENPTSDPPNDHETPTADNRGATAASQNIGLLRKPPSAGPPLPVAPEEKADRQGGDKGEPDAADSEADDVDLSDRVWRQ